MNNIEQKECKICHELFSLDPKAAKRQIVCNKLQCKKEQKRRYNQQWRAKRENADYFKGRYPYLKEWLKQNPGYLQSYRVRKNSTSKQKSSDIQVEITSKINNKLYSDTIKILNDIQVEITTNINKGKCQLQQLFS